MTEWQPIKTAPKDGTRIILARLIGEDEISYLTVARWLEAEWIDSPYWHEEVGSGFADDCTHWMPQPKPPAS